MESQWTDLLTNSITPPAPFQELGRPVKKQVQLASLTMYVYDGYVYMLRTGRGKTQRQWQPEGPRKEDVKPGPKSPPNNAPTLGNKRSSGSKDISSSKLVFKSCLLELF